MLSVFDNILHRVWCRYHRLLEAAQEALTPDSNRYLDIIDKIEHDHLKSVRLAVTSPEIRAEVEVDIKHECKTLKAFLEAAEVSVEIKTWMTT